MPLPKMSFPVKVPMKMPSLLEEFRNFAFKGNMIDLAIAVVIGAAFNTIIKSLVDNIIMPAATWALPQKSGWQNWGFGPEGHRIFVGKFVSDTVNFLIIAFVVFLVLVKFLSLLRKYAWHETVVEPTTKDCPMCTSKIPVKARKCPLCTADLPADTSPSPSPTT